MEKIRNLSLKKTILLYFVISLTAAFLLSGFTVHFARNMQNKIWEKYIDYADYTDVFQQYGKKYEIEISRPNQSQMNRLDHHLSEMCDFMETYSVLIFSIVGSVAAVFFFYKNKLKTPLQELKDASQMIADNELDFHVSYENKDEMGTLCKEFEMMRSTLADNNRKMWRMIDDEKVLRNAIAHDIRSPLSILRGYQEMLLEFVSAESIKTIEVCRLIRSKVLCPILFLTARVDEDDKINGLLSGGDDYITKPFSLRELEARIVTNIKREERHQQKTEYRFMDEMLIDYSEKIVAIAGHRMEFTKIEYQIIEFLSMHPGQVFDKERIYAQVCGYDAEGDSRTITELVRRIRKKIADYSEKEYIETVWGIGYRWKK